MVKKNEKRPLTKKLGQNSTIKKRSPSEKNSKIMCAKYWSSNIKTVPRAQKFCQKILRNWKKKNTHLAP